MRKRSVMKLGIWKISVIVLLLTAGVLVLPFLQHIPYFEFDILSDEHNLFASTLIKTLAYAVVSTFVLVGLGFWGALLLLNVPFFSKLGKNLGILIFPVTLGNISIAFMCKLLLGDTIFFSTIVTGGMFYQLAFLILLQIWQFGLLFIYIFWLNFQSIPQVRNDYAIANRFSIYQSIKDIYYPFSKNLIILLGSIGFVFSLFEEAKISYLFKVSRGTDTELITNWLSRTYQSAMLVSPDYATKLAFDGGVITALAAVVTLLLVFLFINFFSRLVTGSKLYLPSGFSTGTKLAGFRKMMNKGWAWCLIFFIVIPLIWGLTNIQFSLSSSLSVLTFPLAMTLVATIVASIVAIIFGIASRLGWKYMLSSFSNKSVVFFVILFLLMLVPPLVILLSGFRWMGWIGYSSDWMIYAIWIAGHSMLTLPILGSFVLVNHFRVSNNELDYLKVFRLNKRELVKFSFLSRFKAEYLLLFIIGFSFIWNEAVLNNLFSDYIPSFSSRLKMLITGRGADYSLAFGYLLVSIVLALLAVGIWRYIIEKAHKLTLKA